jgi:SAM-dependent methyltransferase
VEPNSTCKLCGARARRRLVLTHTTIWECSDKRCGTQFCEPQLDDQALGDAYARLYYPDPLNAQRAIYENTPASILEQVFRNLDARIEKLPGRTCLDFGCGYGNLSLVAREFGWLLTGIEAEPRGRNAASQRVPMDVYESVRELLQVRPSAKFHLIILWQVIEHLRAPWIDLGMLRGLLEPDGIVIVSTPNADGLKARILRRAWDNYQNQTHFYYFTPRSMAAVLRKSGFSRFERWNFGTSYENHGRLRRALQRALVALELNGELLFAAS